MRLYFVRHGESEANTRHIISNRESPLALTSLGRQQASALGERLQDIAFGAMFGSPVFRARETADILSSAIGIPFQVTEALREYDCGVLEDQSDEESWRMHRNFFEDWTLRQQYSNKPEGGECFLDIQNRFLPFIGSLKVRQEKNVLLIGHGGLFLLMLPLILSNVNHSFAVSHGIGNAEYILAEQRQDELVCLQWGRSVLNETLNE